MNSLDKKMSNIENVTIHIGMPKSASSTLQRNFFRNLPLINYAGLSSNNKKLTKLTTSIYKKGNLYFDENLLLKQIKSRIDPEKPLVISSEYSSGVVAPFSRFAIQNRTTIAQRYKALFPDAKILIIIRNQYDIQKSMYVQRLLDHSEYVKMERLPFQDWIDFNIKDLQEDWGNIFEFADYFPLIQYYANNFREVKVVVFEKMIEDMASFLKDDLSPFIGVSGEDAIPYYTDKIVNRRHTKEELTTRKFTHKVSSLFKKAGNPQRIIPIEQRRKITGTLLSSVNSISSGKIKTVYTNRQKEFLLNYYGENNRKLSEMLEFDLEKYGYPIIN